MVLISAKLTLVELCGRSKSRTGKVRLLFFGCLAIIIWGHGSAPAKSSAKQTLPYHHLLESFRRVFRPLFENLWIRPERRHFRHPGGQFILELVDYYGGTFLVLFTGISECVGVFWIYGLESFCIDVEYMLQRPTAKYWRFCWGIFAPGLMMLVFFYALISFEALVFGGYYVYPNSAYVAGYILLFAGILIVPAYAMRTIYLNKTGTCKQAMKKAFASKKTWGPRVPYDLEEWKKYKATALELQKPLRKTKCKHICMSLTGGYKTAALALARKKEQKEIKIRSQSSLSVSGGGNVSSQSSPASGQSSPSQKGPGQSGPGQSGPGQSGPGQSGPGQSGPSQSGPGQGGPGQSGPGQSSPGQSGPGQSGPNQSYPGQGSPR